MTIRQSTLQNKASSYYKTINVNDGIEAFTTKRSAFLCHSHKDEQLVKGLIVIFEEAGVDLYIDWKDHTMPETPNKETASIIQNRIKQSDVFLFLATSNSKASRWCPWEIGYADATPKKIYIIPTIYGNTTYGNEYLELYKRVDIGSSDTKEGYAIFEPNAQKGQWLSSQTLLF